MKIFINYKLVLFSTFLLLFITNMFAQEKEPWERQVYFGEQHLHTSASADAFAFGIRSTPDDAYNFAKGKPLTLTTIGAVITKSTPLTGLPLLTMRYI